MSIGIIPDILICRTDVELVYNDKQKISSFCNIDYESVIQSCNESSIYKVPISYLNQGIEKVITKKLGISTYQKPDINWLISFIERSEELKKQPAKKIAIAGKYTNLKDSYKSLLEAIYHSSVHCGVNLEIDFLDTKGFNTKSYSEIRDVISTYDGVIVPGGFGTDGLEGKISIIKEVREQNKSFLGICLGMQMAVIEFARNVLGIKNANTYEVLGDDKNYTKVVGFMNEWTNGGDVISAQKKLGGTMRLGNYIANITSGTLCSKIYNSSTLSERHRHRYEVDISYKNELEKQGMIISAISQDGLLPEVIELKNHKFFIAVQFHPEFNSSVVKSNPIFDNFVKSL